MATPERPNIVPYMRANDYFLTSAAQIYDEIDTILNQGRKIDIGKLTKLEEDFQALSQAFDALTHGHNIPFVVSFQRDQVTELSTRVKDQEDYENIQRLNCLAAELSKAA